MYPLIVAAARGMQSVVKYLLAVGADPTKRGSSRFRLASRPSSSVGGVDLTALEFAVRVRDAEVGNGLGVNDGCMRGLRLVIGMLERKERARAAMGAAAAAESKKGRKRKDG